MPKGVRTIDPNETEKALGISMNRFYIPPMIPTKAGNTSWENLPEPTDISKLMKEPCLFQDIKISPDASRLMFEILNKEWENGNTLYDTHLLGHYLECMMYCPFEWVDNV